MNLNDRKMFLKEFDGFDRLDDGELEHIVQIGRVGSVQAGEAIDVQVQPAEKFYVLVSGRLAVVLTLDFGVVHQTSQLITLRPGQMFAERAGGIFITLQATGQLPIAVIWSLMFGNSSGCLTRTPGWAM